MVFDAQRLTVQGLACERGERTLFKNLSFALDAGSGIIVTGPNGAGKTSLLRILAGLLPAFTGEVRFGSTEVPLAERTHFLGVTDGLKPGLTPREHVAFWRALGPADKAGASPASVGDPLTRFGLSALSDTPSGWLSTGQKRRLALTKLFFDIRQLWLLDEPLNGLDGAGAAILQEACEQHLRAGGLLVVASHQPIAWTGTRHLSLSVPSPERHLLASAFG